MREDRAMEGSVRGQGGQGIGGSVREDRGWRECERTGRTGDGGSVRGQGGQGMEGV